MQNKAGTKQSPPRIDQILAHSKDLVLLLSVAGAIYLGKANPEQYAETTKVVITSAIAGYFSASMPQPPSVQIKSSDKSDEA